MAPGLRDVDEFADAQAVARPRRKRPSPGNGGHGPAGAGQHGRYWGPMTDTLLAPSRLRVDDGRILTLDVRRWMAPADPVDEMLLDRAVAPVLDVGCVAGVTAHALHRRGTTALGIDVSPTALALARRKVIV